MKVEILMVSYHFYPENSPRAIRTYELAREFSRRGNDVTLYIPESGFDYKEIESTYGIIIHKVPSGFFLGRKAKAAPCSDNASDGMKIKKRRPRVWKLLKLLLGMPYRMICVEQAGTEFFLLVFNVLSKDENQYDLLISVALNFSSRPGCFMALLKNRTLARARIAEDWDPFSVSEAACKFRHLGICKIPERFVLREFDYVTVPTSRIAELFHKLKESSFLRVIPQICGYSRSLQYGLHKAFPEKAV